MPKKTSSATKPEVGRHVHFYSRGSADGVFPSRTFAAVITRVYNKNKVSLVAYRETGLTFELKVMKGSENGNWDWMPYQKEQAAKESK